jgi:transglutaminase-like putative cysteine protease
MPNPLETYLAPAPGVTSADPAVIDLARRLAKGARDKAEAAIRLFDFARETVAYSPYVPFWELRFYEAGEILRRGAGFCIPKSALLVALARAAGIPARLGFADIENHLLGSRLLAYLGSRIMTFHCFAELYLAGRWLKATPSFERQLCRTQGWRLVAFDGRTDALLPATDLAGRLHVSYLKAHPSSAGVPLADILAAWDQVYGVERVARWRADLEQGQGAGQPFSVNG